MILDYTEMDGDVKRRAEKARQTCHGQIVVCRSKLPADLVHGPLGLDKTIAADAVGRGLVPHAVADQVRDLIVAAAAAQVRASIPLAG
jgi:hypothetical protein